MCDVPLTLVSLILCEDMALESCEGGELFDQITRVSLNIDWLPHILFRILGSYLCTSLFSLYENSSFNGLFSLNFILVLQYVTVLYICVLFLEILLPFPIFYDDPCTIDHVC